MDKLKGEIATIVHHPRAPSLTPATLKLIEAATVIRSDPEDVEWAFMARQLVQCTLPHRNPGNLPVWSRTNGNLTLGIKPGYELKTGKCFGFPYGSIPRLLLFWIVTEAKRTGNRRLELGHSLAEFIYVVGLNPDTGGGKRGDAKRLREQMTRLFRATISFEQSLTGPDRLGTRWLDMQVAPDGELWWDAKMPQQNVLWGSWIELGEKFFEAIIAAPVPLDMRALKALKQSPLALDIYAVMNYRAHTAKEPVFLSWDLLRRQLGTDFADAKNFKKNLLPILRKVLAVAPHLNIKQVRGGLMLHPSRGAIATRKGD
jgi:Plasmid encoded RepA protein